MRLDKFMSSVWNPSTKILTHLQTQPSLYDVSFCVFYHTFSLAIFSPFWSIFHGDEHGHEPFSLWFQALL
jgi:hypothetical protein